MGESVVLLLSFTLALNEMEEGVPVAGVVVGFERLDMFDGVGKRGGAPGAPEVFVIVISVLDVPEMGLV
jgi:hypothetical protein